MEKFLWKIMLTLQKSKLGRVIVSIAYGSGSVYIWNFIVYEKDRRHPTEEMLSSRKFFDDNKDRFKKNLSLLYDEESKKIYAQCIKYRCTHDYHDRPNYNRKNQYFPLEIIDFSRKRNLTFVDCGAYNGDTVRKFKRVARGKYNKIIAFEPDHDNAEV